MNIIIQLLESSDDESSKDSSSVSDELEDEVLSFRHSDYTQSHSAAGGLPGDPRRRGRSMDGGEEEGDIGLGTHGRSYHMLSEESNL